MGGERERVVVRGRGWRGRKAVVKEIKGERGEGGGEMRRLRLLFN